MKYLLTLAALLIAPLAISEEEVKSCPAFKIVNEEGTWNAKDASTLDRAVTRCEERYGPRGNPCLKVFIKKAEDTYNAICGPKE